MLAFDAIAEQRICEAAARGELDGLPGTGRPLALDDDLLIPQELRMAYRILKNAGYVPPEVQTLKEIGELERLIQSLDDGKQRSLAQRKLRLLTLQMNESRCGSLQLEAAYYDKIVSQLAA
ncbi:MAG TPA: DUF1992 domain-containing protein [Methylophilaceae bacterium]|nr:DUF1992 domain-containing protein [Methylophilaceae bacterium]HQR60884.1 DUF1992 domain-containing protein [Methylophilaceae bacterium]